MENYLNNHSLAQKIRNFIP